MRAHVIQGGKVANTIEIAALDALPGVTLIDADLHGGTIGDDWDGAKIVANVQAPPVPQYILRAQAKKALMLHGLLARVQPAIDAIPDPTLRGLVQIDWDELPGFRRQSETLIAIGTALGLSPEQVDALFVEAAAL